MLYGILSARCQQRGNAVLNRRRRVRGRRNQSDGVRRRWYGDGEDARLERHLSWTSKFAVSSVLERWVQCTPTLTFVRTERRGVSAKRPISEETVPLEYLTSATASWHTRCKRERAHGTMPSLPYWRPTSEVSGQNASRHAKPR
jgi:hypothetical protein